VPTVVSSLTTLGNAARDLKAGLETAGAGLTALRDASTKFVLGAEYGVVQLYVGTTPAGGQILNSSDVPDDTNGSTLTGTLLATIPGNATDAPLILRAALRSGEKDGTGAANPAGSAGLVAMTAKAGTPNITISGGNAPPATADVPLTSRPNGTGDPGPDGVPLFQINDKAPRVDSPNANPFAFPTAQSIELTDPATLSPVTGAPDRWKATNAAAGPGVAVVHFTVRFHDLSASATDLDE
jgi:hypothetical protein